VSTQQSRRRAAQPVYEALFGYHVFGLGFVTSMAFIIGTGAPFAPCLRAKGMRQQLFA